MSQAETVEVLHVQDGDTVVVRWQPGEQVQSAATDHAKSIMDMFKRQGKHNVTMLVMPVSMSVENLPEDQMRQLGWVRPARNAEKLIEAKHVIRDLLERGDEADTARAEWFLAIAMETSPDATLDLEDSLEPRP